MWRQKSKRCTRKAICAVTPHLSCAHPHRLLHVSVCVAVRDTLFCVSAWKYRCCCTQTHFGLEPPALHHFSTKVHPLERAIALCWCKAGVGQHSSDPCEHFWTAWGSGLLPTGWVPKPDQAMQVLLDIFSFRHGLLGKEFPFIYFRPGFRTCHLE